jgi:hypothetical protein
MKAAVLARELQRQQRIIEGQKFTHYRSGTGSFFLDDMNNAPLVNRSNIESNLFIRRRCPARLGRFVWSRGRRNFLFPM